MTVDTKWSEAGNPIAYCPGCATTHEWTVRIGDEWRCSVGQQFDDFVAAELQRVIN